MAEMSSGFAIRDARELDGILGRWLERFGENIGKDASGWLADEFAHALPSLGNDAARKIVADLGDYVQAIAESQASLAKARERGMSREEWFFRQLQDSTETMDEQSLGEMTHTLARNAAEAFLTSHAALTGNAGPIAPDALKSDGKSARVWNDASIKGNVIVQQKLYQALHVLGLARNADRDFVPDAISAIPHAEAVTAAIEKGDVAFVTSLACAFREAMDKKVIDVEVVAGAGKAAMSVLEEGLENPACASMSTIVTETLNVAQQIGAGDIDPEDGVDRLVDTAVATAEAVTREAFRKGGERLGQTVGAFITSWCPAIQPAATLICGKIGAFLGEKVADPVCKGIKKLGEYAKNAVGWVADKVSKACDAACNFVSSAWDALTSWW